MKKPKLHLCTRCGERIAAEKANKTQREKYPDYSAEMKRRSDLALKARYTKLKRKGLAKNG